MSRTPSNADLQELVIELCRAAVTLRIAEKRGMISGGGESGRLADGIEKWLAACERQIDEILEPEADQGAAAANVIDLAGERAARATSGAKDDTPSSVEKRSPDKTPSDQRWAELRARLHMISSTMTKA